MNRSLFFISLIISLNVSANLWIIPKEERALRLRPKRDKVVDVVKHKASSQVEGGRDYSEIDMFLKKAGETPAIWDYTVQFDIKTGTVFKGTLLNSVVSTNLESPLLVVVNSGQGLPEGTKFSCAGTTKHKRIISACNLMITPGDSGEEYDVKVVVLNRDGSAGLKADYIYEGSEKLVTGSLASNLSQGVLESVAIGTGGGIKSGLASGALNTANDMSSMARNEIQTNEPKIAVYAGKEVLIYFKKRFKL